LLAAGTEKLYLSSCLLRVCRNTKRTGKRRTACGIKREGSCWILSCEWQSENMPCGPKQSGGNREFQMGLWHYTISYSFSADAL